jgi:hypothetical protein
MSSGRIRDERDDRLKTWERELERLRVALGRAPDAVHEQYSSEFTALYRAKETVKSRWEAIRGVYRPAPAEIEGVQVAFETMGKAWVAAQAMIAAVLAQDSAAAGSEIGRAIPHRRGAAAA